MTDRILVVAAHPDDELLGCGGTLASYPDAADVTIAILGEGISSRSAARAEAEHDALARLHRQAHEVGTMLGARSVILERLPDNRFDELPLLDVVKVVERLVRDIQPTIIYTHHPGDLNIDHLVTFRAVMTATRPVGGSVEEIYAFEVASSTEWAFQQFQPPFQPNCFVDISKGLETKVAAMAVYESEARSFPHPRSAEALRVQARRWGSVCGLEYAEAFQLIRSIRPPSWAQATA